MMRSLDVELNTLEAILARRSVRSYTTEEVDRATVRVLLEAAIRAPTAEHKEPWAFVVIQDRLLLQQLSDRAKPIFMDEIGRFQGHAGHADLFTTSGFNVFYDAGTLIVICAKSNGPFNAADCWLAAENLILAACAMGLGTCVIGAAQPALNHPEMKAELNIPREFLAVAPIIVGYARGEVAPTTRKEPLILSYLSQSRADPMSTAMENR